MGENPTEKSNLSQNHSTISNFEFQKTKQKTKKTHHCVNLPEPQKERNTRLLFPSDLEDILPVRCGAALLGLIQAGRG